MKHLITLMLVGLCFPIFSQTLTDQGVLIPLETYRIVRHKFYLSDSIISIQKEEIAIQDSIISSQDIQIKSFKVLSAQKDTTISQLHRELLIPDEKISKPFTNHMVWIAGFAGLIIGILLVR